MPELMAGKSIFEMTPADLAALLEQDAADLADAIANGIEDQ